MRIALLALVLCLAMFMNWGGHPGSASASGSLEISSEPPVTTISVGDLFSYNITVTGETSQMVLETAPAGMMNDGTRLTWTPARGQEGHHMVQFKATNHAGNRARQMFLINVLPSGGITPSIAILWPPQGSTIDSGSRLQVSGVVGSDSDVLGLTMFLDGKQVARRPIDGQGRWSVDMQDAIDPGQHTISVRVASSDGTLQNETHSDFLVVQRVPEVDYTWAIGVPLYTASLVMVLLAFTDAFKYRVLTILLVPLYSRLDRDNLHDKFTRGKIFQFIKDNPGETFTTMKKALEMSNGALTYNLKILEDEGIIHSKRNGLFRHFFPKDMPLPDKVFRLSHVQKGIIEFVKKNPGITQKRLAEKLAVTPATMNYHLSFLIDAGIVRVERKGISKRYTFVSAIDEDVHELNVDGI